MRGAVSEWSMRCSANSLINGRNASRVRSLSKSIFADAVVALSREAGREYPVYVFVSLSSMVHVPQERISTNAVKHKKERVPRFREGHTREGSNEEKKIAVAPGQRGGARRRFRALPPYPQG